MSQRTILAYPHPGPAPELSGTLDPCSVCGSRAWVSANARFTAGHDAAVGCLSCAKTGRFKVGPLTTPSSGIGPDQTRDIFQFLIEANRPALPPEAAAAKAAPSGPVDHAGILASIRKRLGITVSGKTAPGEDLPGEDDEGTDEDEV